MYFSLADPDLMFQIPCEICCEQMSQCDGLVVSLANNCWCYMVTVMILIMNA